MEKLTNCLANLRRAKVDIFEEWEVVEGELLYFAGPGQVTRVPKHRQITTIVTRITYLEQVERQLVVSYMYHGIQEENWGDSV